MVLGANLGGSLIAYVLTLGADQPARRIVIANLALRGGGAALALFFLQRGAAPLELLGSTPPRQVINLHLAFNLALMLVALPLTVPVLRLVDRLAPDPATSPALKRVSALDPAALRDPDRALACVMRELLQMGEAVESMLRSVIGLYADWEEDAAEAIRKKEREVDRIHINTKLYLAKLQRDHSGDEVASRALELADMAVNLESAGNVISDTMLSLAQRLNRGGVAFSDKGLEEIRDFHDRVLSNAQGALNLLVTSSPDAARALVEEKDTVRDVEQGLQRAHLARLQQGLSESIETSNLHQETLRALKQVNSAFTMLAYPILSETGDLLASRLSRPKP